MAFALEVYVIDKGDHTIKVQHTFFGVTEEEAQTYYREHQSSCEYFRAAVQEGRVIEELDEIDDEDMPDPDDWEDDPDD